MIDDLVEPLRAAIERADPSWATQPSHLRRRLDEELGSDSRQHRAQVHQLVVAAEERIPVRLQRSGWSPDARAELVDVLVGARGWTPEASEWTVVTWAAALDLTTERVPIPSARARPAPAPSPSPVATTEVPTWSAREPDVSEQDASDETLVVGHGVVLAGAEPLTSTADRTVLPGDGTISARTEVPAPAGVEEVPAPDAHEPVPNCALEAPASPVVPSGDLPRSGTKASTKQAKRFLDQEIDVAYNVMAGPSPAWLVLAAPIPAAISLAGPPALRGVVLMVFMLVIIVGRALWPKRILAVSGSRVWLMKTKGSSTKPRDIISETTRDQIQFAGGFPPSIRIDGQRLWFLFPSTSAARALPVSAEVAE